MFKERIELFVRRGIALFIDSFIIVFFDILFFSLLGLFFKLDVILTNSAIMAFGAFLFAGYTTYMLGKYGQTIGKKWLNIIVLKDDGSRIEYLRAFLRYLSYVFAWFTLTIGFIVSLFNKRNKTIYDYIVGTEVKIVKPE